MVLNMMIPRLIKLPTMILATYLVAACGGGGGDSSSPPTTPPIVQTPTPLPVVTITSNPHQARFTGDQDLSLFLEFFEHGKLPQIDITITQEQWDALISDLNTNIKSKTSFKANANITTASGSTVIEEIGFRVRGNTTRKIPEINNEYRVAHFKLSFNETFDLPEDSVAYLARDERRFANLRALNLKSPTLTNDSPHMRELFAYDLFNQVGVNAPMTNLTRLIIHIGNETIDYGVYTAIEPIDKAFLRKRYGDDDNEGNLYKCLWQEGGPATLQPFDYEDEFILGLEVDGQYKPSYDLKTNKNTEDHSNFIDFVEQIDNLSGTAFKTYIDENFEIDKLLRLLAMNILIGMPDDYWAMGNNYYLYFNNNGKIEMYPFDYDHTFGQGWQPIETAQADIFDWWNGVRDFTGNTTPRPLITKIFAIDEYRNQYQEYLREFSNAQNGVFNYNAFQSKYEQVRALIDPDNNNLTDGDVSNLSRSISIDGIDNYFQLKSASISLQTD